MAQVGTGVQMAAIGPQNKRLDLDPDVTYFYSKTTRTSTFASEPQEELPLQTAGFGKTVVFEVPARGDLLGDMYLQFNIPAVQPLLGASVPAQSPLPPDWRTAWPSVPVNPESVSNHDGSLWLTLNSGMSSVAHPFPILSVSSPSVALTTTRWEMLSGQGFAWEVVFDTGRLEVAAYASGYLVSTLYGSEEQTLAIGGTNAGLSPTTTHFFPQIPGTSVCLMVAVDGTVVTKNDTWRSPLAYVLMRRVRFMVDDLVLHDHERLWYDLCDRLSVRQGHARGMAEMLGVGLSMGAPHTLHLPLKFMCCARPHSSRTFFPVALVPNCRVSVELQIERFFLAAPADMQVQAEPPPSLDVRLVAERVWLGTDERNTMLLKPLTIGWESEQDMDAVNYSQTSDGGIVGSTRVSIDLSEMNLPVKALAWVVYQESTPRLFEYLDLVQDASLLFGSLERASSDGDTFRRQQAWSHAPRCERGNVYLYSFALRVWDESPCGSADFSVLQKPVLRLQLRPEAASQQLKCKVWGMTYNWLTFERGKVTRVFST